MLLLRRKDAPDKLYNYNYYRAKSENMEFIHVKRWEDRPSGGRRPVGVTILSKDFLPRAAGELAEVEENFSQYRPKAAPKRRRKAAKTEIEDAPELDDSEDDESEEGAKQSVLETDDPGA